MPRSSIRRAVVLAAGRGTRMGEATRGLPKPMLPLHGRPMLEHVLERLTEAGIEKLLVVVGYHHHLVERHFRKRRLPIEFRVQEHPDGTGSAARLARDFAGDSPFLLTFGDILCEPAAIARCGRVLDDYPDAVAVLGVRDVDDPWRGAAVYVEEGRVVQVIEKPPIGTSTTRWNSAGLFALQPVAFQYLDRLPLSPRGEYELTSVFEMMLQDGLEVRISPMEGSWRDVGYPEDLEAANADFRAPLLGPQPPDHPDQDQTAGDKHGQ